MNKFESYIKLLGGNGAVQEKVNKICEFYEIICKEVIKDIFITDRINKLGSRQFESLILFSENHVMEAKNFLVGEDFDMDTLHKRIRYWEIIKENYDFTKSNKDSRLSIRAVLTRDKSTLLLIASENNCDELKDRFIKYILPNLTG